MQAEKDKNRPAYGSSALTVVLGMGHVKTLNVWRCDHCGKEEVWGPNWRSRLILHRSGGPGPWDEELVACSDECAIALDGGRKPPNKNKGGLSDAIKAARGGDAPMKFKGYA